MVGKKSDKATISIDSSEIEHVFYTKFLGVSIDSNFDWRTHINHLVHKLSKCIYVLHKKNSKTLDCTSLAILYCSLFYHI